jgi:hypothetical protein
LAERGLGVAKPDTKPVIRNFSRPASFWRGEPSELAFEVVLEGEMPNTDFDLMVDTVRRFAGQNGTIETVGRSMTWVGSSLDVLRPMQISVFPRNGKTTIRVSDSVRGKMGILYASIISVFGGAVGAMSFGIAMSTIHRFWEGGPFNRMTVVSDRPVHVAAGLGLWALAASLSVVAARFFANSTSTDRAEQLKSLLERLSEQALDSIRFNDKS